MQNVRCDEPADSNWFLDDGGSETRSAVRDDVAVDASGLLGVPLEEAGGKGDLAQSIRLGLAVLPGDQGGQILLVLHDEIKPATQDARALSAGAGAPTGKRVGGGADGRLRILSGGFGAGTDQGTSGRVWDCV